MTHQEEDRPQQHYPSPPGYPEAGDECELDCDGILLETRVGPGPVGEPALQCNKCDHEVLLA